MVCCRAVGRRWMPFRSNRRALRSPGKALAAPGVTSDPGCAAITRSTKARTISMDPDFWQERWREGRIGFHQEQVTPLLEQYWDAAGVAPGARVFVPLAGKTRDMAGSLRAATRCLGSSCRPSPSCSSSLSNRCNRPPPTRRTARISQPAGSNWCAATSLHSGSTRWSVAPGCTTARR